MLVGGWVVIGRGQRGQAAIASVHSTSPAAQLSCSLCAVSELTLDLVIVTVQLLIIQLFAVTVGLPLPPTPALAQHDEP